MVFNALFGPARRAGFDNATRLRPMSQTIPASKFLVLSRGQWDEDKTPAQIQEAIDSFYLWSRAAASSTDLSLKPRR
jgi:hypothetical protein